MTKIKWAALIVRACALGMLGGAILASGQVPTCSLTITTTRPSGRDAKEPANGVIVAGLRPLVPREVAANRALALGGFRWVDSTDTLVCSYQRQPLASSYSPGVALLDSRTGSVTTILPPQKRPSGRYAYYDNAVASHDGRMLAYSAFSNPNPVGKRSIEEVWVGSLRAEFSRQVASIRPSQIEWTPDDRRLVFCNRSGLWIVDRDGRGLTRLSAEVITEFELSPRGMLIAYVVAKLSGQKEWHYQLWVVNLGTKVHRRVSTDARSPSWQGDMLWYLVGKPPPGRALGHASLGQVLVRRQAFSGTGGLQVIARPPAGKSIVRAQVSPDGTRLWVLLWDLSLWLVKSDGTGWLRLADKSFLASWSPDGKRLAWWFADSSMFTHLYVVEVRHGK